MHREYIETQYFLINHSYKHILMDNYLNIRLQINKDP